MLPKSDETESIIWNYAFEIKETVQFENEHYNYSFFWVPTHWQYAI